MSTSVLVGLISLCIFLIILLLGVPVSVCMMICGVGGCMFLLANPISAFDFLGSEFVNTFTSYTTSVAPLFMLMGELASESGLGSNLFDAFQKLVGRLRGGLASAVQVACAIFGAICGSAAATAALMSRVAYPQMKKYHYSDELATGCIASGASLATLIPPSLVLIGFGIAAEESIGKLFFGGIFTGIVLMVVFIIIIQIWGLFRPSIAPQGVSYSFKEKWAAIRKGSFIEIVIVFGISMGGLFAGLFTPTEAGAVGSVGMLLVIIFTKRFSFKMLVRALENTLVMNGVIYCLLAGAGVFGKLFTLSRIPVVLGEFVTGLDIPKFLIILAITIIYLILGCFIDVMPMILLTTPIFLPIVEALGYNAIWFGCYVTVIAGLGAVTPPVGISCYVVSGVCEGVPLQRVFKGSIPFIIGFIVTAMLLAFFPAIATWLPEIIFG